MKSDGLFFCVGQTQAHQGAYVAISEQKQLTLPLRVCPVLHGCHISVCPNVFLQITKQQQQQQQELQQACWPAQHVQPQQWRQTVCHPKHQQSSVPFEYYPHSQGQWRPSTATLNYQQQQQQQQQPLVFYLPVQFAAPLQCRQQQQQPKRPRRMMPKLGCDDAFKTEMCRRLLLSESKLCSFGDDCKFAHSAQEARPRQLDSKYKTEPCQNWKPDERSSCKFRDRCSYLHDEQALPPRVSGSPLRRLFDPTLKLVHEEIQPGVWQWKEPADQGQVQDTVSEGQVASVQQDLTNLQLTRPVAEAPHV
jgi:hypothetical protein